MNKRKLITIVVLAIFLSIALFLSLNYLIVQYMWFSQLDFTNIFWKEFLTKLKIGIPLFVLFLALFALYSRFLRRISQRFIGALPKKLTKKQKHITNIVLVIISLLFANGIADALWMEALEFYHGQAFDTTDALWGLNLSFYFFKLPFLTSVYHLVMNIFWIVVVITFLYSFYIMFSERNDRVLTIEALSDAGSSLSPILKKFLELASLQIGVFLACFFLLTILGSFLDLLDMPYGGTGMVYGAGAADSMIGIPGIYIRIGLCIIGIGLAIYAGLKQKKRLLIGCFVGLLVFNLGTSLVQTIYERFVVVPSQYTQETPYIEKNIAATRESYALENVEIKEFAADANITTDDLYQNETTIDNIPINDENPTKDMYDSLQGIRNYYNFDDVDVDRYTIDNTYTQVFIGARELNTSALPDEAQTWVNTHLKYTHGYGLAMSPVKETTAAGQPEVVIGDIPPETDYESLDVTNPAIYFGNADYDYAVTNTKTPEFDYPDNQANAETWYEGSDGIQLNFFKRLCFALYYRDSELLFSNEITDSSRLLMHRNILDRVQTLAPFLTYDEDPYLVLSEGHLYWFIDAYTTSSRFPYSQPFDDQNNNYIKNPVKVVVDAYNGSMTFYKVQDEPILDTYAGIFPNLIKDIDEMPADLREHVRYSKKLFSVQSQMYATYHMEDSQTFYNKEDQWENSKQFYGDSKDEVAETPAYTIMKLPDRDAEFILTTTFTPSNKDNMVAWLAGISDGDDYGQLILYRFPKSQVVYGPLQIEQRIEQSTIISPQLTLLSQEGSRVLRGNMMCIPIENAIIYVEPVYIEATGGENNLPEVKKVIVAYQNNIVMENTLDEALAQIFDGFDADSQSTTTDTTSIASTGLVLSTITSLSDQASTLYDEALTAQKNGDWTTYGEKIDALKTVLDQLSETTK